MSLPENIREWYNQFLRLAAEKGIDVKSPESANHFNFINLSEHSKKGQTEYRDDPTPITAPAEEALNHVDDPIWRFSNSTPIGDMTEDQIMLLYNKAKEGLVSFSYVGNNGNDHMEMRHIVYTGDDALPHLSGETFSFMPLDGPDADLSKENFERVKKAFPYVDDPKLIAISANHYDAGSRFTDFGFALTSDQIDLRGARKYAVTKLYEDLQKHPDYYKDPQIAEERKKLVTNGSYRSWLGKNVEIPKEYKVDNPIDDMCAGAERNIEYISTLGKSANELIKAGLVRRADGTPYTNGDKPWSAISEITRDLKDGKKVNIFRPGDTKDAPEVLEGELRFEIVKGVGDFAMTCNGESKVKNDQRKFDEKAFKGVQAHETVYGGLCIQKGQKEELEKQPVGDMLNFTPNDDGTYQMNLCLPEMINTTNEVKVGKDIRYRETVNCIFKTFAQKCFDENGNFEPSGFKQFSNQYFGLQEWDRRSEECANLFNIPEERREDFYEIVTNDMLAESLLYHLDASIDDLIVYQSTLDGLYKKDAPTDPGKEKVLSDSYGDFQRRISRLREMANMDPVNEKRVLNYADCGCSATWNQNLVKMLNTYRTNHGMKPIEGKKFDVHFDSKKDNPAENMYNAFNAHSLFLFDVKLNGCDVKLSAETTAPKSGKLMFVGEKGENALGLYRDEAELEAFHKKDSYYRIENFDKYAEIKSLKAKNIPKRVGKDLQTGSHILETKMRLAAEKTSHTFEELTTRLASSKVDHPLKRSSANFRVMKECFEKVETATKPIERINAIAKLNLAAQMYLDFKEPKGNAKKEAKLTDYAKRRIKFVQDVLEYTSVELNKNHIKVPVVPDVRNNEPLKAKLKAEARERINNEPQLQVKGVNGPKPQAKGVNGLKPQVKSVNSPKVQQPENEIQKINMLQ